MGGTTTTAAAADDGGLPDPCPFCEHGQNPRGGHCRACGGRGRCDLSALVELAVRNPRPLPRPTLAVRPGCDACRVLNLRGELVGVRPWCRVCGPGPSPAD